jgi:hypothetical protein
MHPAHCHMESATHPIPIPVRNLPLQSATASRALLSCSIIRTSQRSHFLIAFPLGHECQPESTDRSIKGNGTTVWAWPWILRKIENHTRKLVLLVEIVNHGYLPLALRLRCLSLLNVTLQLFNLEPRAAKDGLKGMIKDMTDIGAVRH